MRFEIFPGQLAMKMGIPYGVIALGSVVFRCCLPGMQSMLSGNLLLSDRHLFPVDEMQHAALQVWCPSGMRPSEFIPAGRFKYLMHVSLSGRNHFRKDQTERLPVLPPVIAE
jgi:hypothetical protein